jgi:hypothetical protein
MLVVVAVVVELLEALEARAVAVQVEPTLVEVQV